MNRNVDARGNDRRKTILIVEDEPAIVDNIQYVLETEGFETVAFSSGLPLIPFLSKEPADLIRFFDPGHKFCLVQFCIRTYFQSRLNPLKL